MNKRGMITIGQSN